MKTPLISIIIPCYNGEHFIENAIHSCIQETYQNVEIIVIDDGSKDTSKKVVENLSHQLSQIKPIFQENKGVCAARNAGLEIAKGDFFIFLDADDILLPNSIFHLVELQKETNTDVVVGLTTLNTKKELLKNDFSFFEYLDNPIASLIKKWWPISAVMVRNNKIKWDETMKVWEVVDYFFRLLLEYNFSCTFTDYYVSQINDYENEDRITTAYNHYEPINSAKFFARLYQMLKQNNKIDYQKTEALNYQLMNFVYQAFQNNLTIEKYIYQSIQRKQLKTASNFKSTGLTGWCYFFGVEKGMKLFFQANKVKSLFIK
ncbi:glycosyltransferase family 2 protein [Bernardetia sp. Wsw4-3y2]|uniref:glycosyltransferase family 2 protein n=1 Tax=unclassified Bernardetia TaxID=2647129 RepID=UPI0030CD7B48